MQGQDFLHIRVYRFTHDSTLIYQLICSDSDELRTLAKMVCDRFSVPFEQSATYLNKSNANIGLIFKSSKLSYHLILTKSTFKLTLNQLLKEDSLESMGIDLPGSPVNLESMSLLKKGGIIVDIISTPGLGTKTCSEKMKLIVNHPC